MARTKGAANRVQLIDREVVSTTASQEILHLSRNEKKTPLEQLVSNMRTQQSYLDWIDSRHSLLQDAQKAALKHGPGLKKLRGPKDATYRKYRWYAEQQALLEAINGLEVFYKASLIALATSIQQHISPQKIKGAVDAKVLWVAPQGLPLVALIFEHRLFHDLEAVDEALKMLVNKGRYTPANLKGPLIRQVVAIQCVFQMRHTLSHNQGRVTNSDSAKFAALGFRVQAGEVLDPGKDQLGIVIRDLIKTEASDFTAWLLKETAGVLKALPSVPSSTRTAIESALGKHEDLDGVAWI